MAEYDFRQLSSYDFEILVKDLLQEELGVTLESFKPGKDDGIDLRYSKHNSNLIIQCKHFKNSSFSNLKSKMKYERTKLDNLKIDRYILVTSMGLTPKNKEILLSILDPYCKTPGDIIGRNELNSLISKFENVEKKHYKLWLTSTNILEKVIHNDTYTKSKMELEAILNNSKYYVQNKGFNRAQKILNKQNYCIISGIPGIGKTTLAGILALYFIDKGYEFHKMNSVDDALKVYNSSRKQFFYYDDFLGQTTFEEKLGKNEDGQLLRFIDIVSKNKNSKLVMTTREYILNQSKLTYEKLDTSNFDINKCILKLDDYSRLDKARILYNHLYFSDIKKHQKEEVIFDKRYLKIIDHKNFNPRIIEWMTVKYSLSPSAKSYFELFIDMLNDPEDLWLHIYSNQLHFCSKNLLLVLTSLPDKISKSQLRSVFLNFHFKQSNQYRKPIGDNDFINALKELDGTFIASDKNNIYNSVLISFGNPSIRDFMENIIRKNLEEYCTIIKSVAYFSQILKLNSFLKTDTNIAIYINDIKDAIERCFECNDFPGEYMMSLAERLTFTMDLFSKLDHRDDTFIEKLFYTVTDRLRFCDLEDYLRLLEKIESLQYSNLVNKRIFHHVKFIILLYDFYDELSDYKIVINYCETYEGFLSYQELEYIKNQFEDYYADGVNYSIEGAEYTEELEEYMDDLEDMGNFFDVDIHSEAELLNNKVHELLESEKKVEDDDYYDEGFYKDSYYESRVEERMIDEMFEKLLDDLPVC